MTRTEVLNAFREIASEEFTCIPDEENIIYEFSEDFNRKMAKLIKKIENNTKHGSPKHFMMSVLTIAASFAIILTAVMLLTKQPNNPVIDPATTNVPIHNETNAFSGEITSTDSHEENIGNDDPLCNHEYHYHSIDGCFTNYVDEHAPGWSDKFIDMFGRTEDCNIRFFTDYFGIPKEDFWIIVGSQASDFGIDYEDFFNTDRWYADDYATNEYFITDDNPAPDSGSVMIRPEGDTIHTDRYFTIHKSLIDFVGEERFEEFKELYGGTDGFNVLNFIDYFHISRERFANIMEEQKKLSYYIYNVDYVYGTEEQQKMYFEKHIIEVNE